MEKETIGAPVDTEPAKISDNQAQEVVTEPAKISDNQEGLVAEVIEAPQEVIPYSEEEIRNAKDFKTLDPAKLAKSYEAKDKAYKEMQGEYTKVAQRQSVQPKSQRPADPYNGFAYDVFEAFEQGNHLEVTKKMNNLSELIDDQVLEYAELQFIDPDKAVKLKQSIVGNRRFKSRLDNALAQSYQDQSLNATLYGDLNAEISRAMPNFNDVAPEIGSFVMKDLHFDKDTIMDTMDAKIYIPGLMNKYGISRQEAAKRAKVYVFQLTKGMHDIFMRISGKGIKDKENRTPNKTEMKGSDFTHKSKTAKDMNDNELESEINRLKFGGK